MRNIIPLLLFLLSLLIGIRRKSSRWSRDRYDWKENAYLEVTKQSEHKSNRKYRTQRTNTTTHKISVLRTWYVLYQIVNSNTNCEVEHEFSGKTKTKYKSWNPAAPVG